VSFSDARQKIVFSRGSSVCASGSCCGARRAHLSYLITLSGGSVELLRRPFLCCPLFEKQDSPRIGHRS
jgi:hypothetical protein